MIYKAIKTTTMNDTINPHVVAYTELFLYHNTATSQSSYGLISYNSKTGKTTHKIQIDYDSYDLMIALNKAMLYMQQPNPFD